MKTFIELIWQPWKEVIEMVLDEKVAVQVDKLKKLTIERRRFLHAYPEPGWTEFHTAAFAAKILTNLGYAVSLGDAVLNPEKMMGVPEEAILKEAARQAIKNGAKAEFVDQMAGGKTGIMAVFKFALPGPVVALRFDMDSNDVCEAQTEDHRPYKCGFGSKKNGAMHACGHDGHTAVGLTVAQVLMSLKDELAGTIKLIFQPAEEGVRGARAMTASGIVDDVDYMLGAHFGFKMKHTGQVACDVTGFLATSKYDAEFIGIPAHAGAAPEAGRNALLAAACATLNLHAISRHSDGASRINVGSLVAGSGRNIIGDKAVLKLETRGATSKINQYMAGEALRIIKAAAAMYDVKLKIREVGSAAGGSNTPELSKKVQMVAERLAIFDDIVPTADFGASEDFSYYMERVQKKGGQAAYMMVGADLAAGHHDSYFDFDETALDYAAKLLSSVTAQLLTDKFIEKV